MAGFTVTAKDQALNALAGVNPTNTWVYLSLHSADPGTTGINELPNSGAYARQLTTWSAAAASQMAGTQVTFNVAAGNTIVYWGIWTSGTYGGGTFGFSELLPASQTYGSSGLYFLTVTLTATG